jgi:hypothetical protein
MADRRSCEPLVISDTYLRNLNGGYGYECVGVKCNSEIQDERESIFFLSELRYWLECVSQ